LSRTEEAFYGLFANLPNRYVAWLMRGIIFPFVYPYGREFEPPRDRLGHEVATLLLQPGSARDRLTAGVFIPTDPHEPIAALEAALRAVIAAEPVGSKIRKAREEGRIESPFADQIVDEAVAKGIITADEKAAMDLAKRLRRQVIMVDDFPKDLGKSEIFQSTEAVTFESLRGRTSWPELEQRGGHRPNPAT
jgi:acyl-CoA dehydrogenase